MRGHAVSVQQNIKAVVVACNTASAWALPTLEKKFKVPIFGVILPGVRAALEKTRNRRIGVIGTGATIRSKAYGNGLLARCERRKFSPAPARYWCRWLRRAGRTIASPGRFCANISRRSAGIASTR